MKTNILLLAILALDKELYSFYFQDWFYSLSVSSMMISGKVKYK